MTRRAWRRLRHLARPSFIWLLILCFAAGALPTEVLPSWFPLAAPKAADAETLSSPRYVSAAVMPSGQVGLLFLNVNGSSSEIRFVRYTDEHTLGSSVQLSTAGPMYPQLAVLGSTVVAAYVDTRSPNGGKLIFRTSTDSGATWSAESNPFGSETFDTSTLAPRVVASHSGATLYIFTAAASARPQYRSSTNLTSWTSAAAAGDTSMRVVSGNSCGSAGQECYRAHAFGFMETATSGTWVYIAKSDSGWGQSGRGTQVGTLGGSWSTQVDHYGSGSLSGAGGQSTATTFLDRSGNIYYLRAGEKGEILYFEKSVDNGSTWGPPTLAYLSGGLADYLAAAPVGLYVPGYGLGEYVWYAGFAGTEDTLRVVPLWTRATPYSRSGTVRLLGSAGSDLDAASSFPYNFGDRTTSLGAGGYTTSQTDLALPGRLLPFAFTRTYNSAATTTGVLGPGWRHSFEWSVAENGDQVVLTRGDGQENVFTKVSGAYVAPLGVFDTLVKNTDGSFTLTTRDQLQYELAKPVVAYSSLVTSASPAGYWRLGESSGTSAADSSGHSLGGTYNGTYTLGAVGALTADSNTAVSFGGGYVDMGSPSGLNISGSALTVELWAKGTPGAYNYLVSHTDGGSQGYAIYTGGDAQLHFYFGRSGGLHIGGAVSGVWDNSWHHVAAVYDGSQMLVYVDGLLKLAENETAALTAYSGNFRVAGYNGGSYTFSGSLDEVAVYGSALSATTIAAHAAANPPDTKMLTRIHEPAGNSIDLTYTMRGLTTITDTVGRAITLGYDASGQLQTLSDSTGRSVRYGYDSSGRLSSVWDRLANAAAPTGYSTRLLASSPTAYWRLGESSGTSAADASGNGNTGTYTGSPTLGVSGAIAGDSNTAVTFSGSNYVSGPSTGGLNITGSAVTLEAWVKGTGQGTYKYLVSKYVGGGGYGLYTGSSATLNFFVITSVTGFAMATAPASPWDNVWHYVVGTYDGATVKLYVDGLMVGTVTATGSIGSSSSAALNLARYNGGSGYEYAGSLDEVAVTPSVLTDADFAARLYGPQSWAYAYDGTSRHLSTVTDPDGRTSVTNTWSGDGRLATRTDGASHQTTFASTSTTVTVTDPRGHDTVTTYDARKRPTDVADTLGATTYHLQYAFDDCGNVSSVTDRRGNATTLTYDTGCKGNLLTLEEPQLDPYTARFTTTWTYDSKNNPTLRTDAKSFTTAWTYDGTSNMRVSETRQIDGSTNAVTKWSYGDSANPALPTRIVFPRGNTTGTPNNTYSSVLVYDSSGNLSSSTDADGNQTTYAYDTLGRRTSMVDPDGNVTGGTPSQHTWSTAYDVLDRVTSETDPLSHATSSTYDKAGNRLTLSDKNGNVTTSTYDGASRLATIAQKPDPSGSPSTVYTTTLARDDNGNVTSVTQGNSVVTDYAYDALNRNTSMTTHPTGGSTLVTSYTFDGNGNVATRTTADSVVTTYTRDNLDRLTQIAASGLSTITYAYDELSRRTSMVDVTGTTTYTYDRMGRMTQAAQPNGTTSYVYDLDSNRTTLTYPGSSAVTYSYSYAGRLSSLTDWGSRTSSYTYTAAGLAATVTLPNSMITTYTYDRAQRLTNLTNVISSTTITSHAYTLDSEGNRTALSEFVSGITTGASDSFGLTYDGLERLTAVTTTNAESFTLDGASNITARTGPSKTFSIDGSNRPTSDGTNTLTWSSADRLTGRGSDSFGFDPLDRLTSSTVSSTARTYAYNGDGLLESRTTGGSSVNLLWDPTTSPSRLLASGSDKIVYGLGPLYSVNGSTVTTYARDGQKSIRAELSGSSVTSSWRYRAYGDVVQNSGAATPSLLGYAGQLLDPSGLLYMRARWYDPVNSRFVTRDLLRGDPASPLTLNAFAYASGNPAISSDPTGMCTDPSPGAASTRYCVAAFIRDSWTCFAGYCGAGNDRGPSSADDRSKVQFGLASDGTLLSSSVGFTRRKWFWQDPGEKEKASGGCEQSGAATTTCDAKAGGDLLWYGIRVTATIDGSTMTLRTSSYPSVEAWAYYSDGSARMIFFNQESFVGPVIGLWPVWDFDRTIVLE